MINNYKLLIKDCDFNDMTVNHSFDVVKVYKNTFADSISMINCKVNSITGNVLALNKETDDIGIYNAENVFIEDCQFKNIGGVVLNLHRGGRDESTFGPILDMKNCQFENVGHDKRNQAKAAVSLFGVQLADMKNLDFKECKKMNLHLIVGDPVIKLSDIAFNQSEGMVTNDDAVILKNITNN